MCLVFGIRYSFLDLTRMSFRKRSFWALISIINPLKYEEKNQINMARASEITNYVHISKILKMESENWQKQGEFLMPSDVGILWPKIHEDILFSKDLRQNFVRPVCNL